MLHFWNFQWFWLYVVLVQLNITYVRTAWPSVNYSQIQLLGLFPDPINASETTTLSVHSAAMFKAAIILAQQYNITIAEQYIGWQSIQTGGDGMIALRETCQLISTSNIFGVVGPAYSRESHFIAPYTAMIGIPAISYSATDPELSDRNAYPSFYRTVPSDNTAALAIVKLFSRYNWTSCVIIYQNDAFGSGGVNAITRALNNQNLVVVSTIAFDIITLSIQGDLKSLLTESSTRIIILWASAVYASIVLQNAIDADVLGPRFMWILSSSVPLNTFNQTSYEKLIGIFTVEPVVGNVVNAPVNITLLNAAYNIWQQYEPETFPKSNNIDYYALFAFDATWTLIQSLKELCSTLNNNSTSCLSFIHSSFCFDRYFINSKSLFNILDNNSFLGVSGPIQFSSNVTDRLNGIYYITKNIQRSSNTLNYISVLIWSGSGNWTIDTQSNTIIWPGNSLISPTGYASLSGVTLRIALTLAAPFSIVEPFTEKSGETINKIVGYMPDLIDLLKAKMGFISNITIVPTNQTYNSLIDDVANDVYDLVVADMTITAARREKVTFSSSVFDNSLRVIIRKTPTSNVDLLSYLKPFSLKLWITLLFATIYAGILICLFERQENEALRNRSIISLFAMSMWYSISTMMGFGIDIQMTTAAGRLLTVGLFIISLILVAAYTANLASDLTVSKSQGIISGIDDIKNGKVAYSRVGILTDSSIEDYYLREISDNSRNFYPLQTDIEMYNDLLNNIIDASIMDSGAVEYATSQTYCNLTVVGTDFGESSFGIVSQKNWLYQQTLDVNILSLRESGDLDDLKKKWFQSTSCSPSSDTSSTAMTIESMAGLFLTFAVISILALGLFIWLKRLIIKKYLFKLIYRKNLANENNELQMKKHSQVSTFSDSNTYSIIYL